MRALFVSSGDLESLRLGVGLGARFGSEIAVRIAAELPEGWLRIAAEGLPEGVLLAESAEDAAARALEEEAEAIAAKLGARPELAEAVEAKRASLRAAKEVERG